LTIHWFIPVYLCTWFWIKYAASRRDLVAGITVRFVSAARLPRAGERISSAFVESTVNVVVSKRFAKKQQMQWTPRGAHRLLQVRTRTLDGTLRSRCESWHPGLANDNRADVSQVDAA
jgi:hypothetical protein